MFKRIVMAGGLAGLAAGLLLTALQALQVVPIILTAETFEHEAATETAGHAHGVGEVGGRHHRAGWAPADGLERAVFTGIANIGTAVGFGLLLTAAFALRERVTLPQGALWGLAGFGVFFVAPSLGLLPELPGAEAAALAERQAWWLVTIVCTGCGFALIFLTRNWGMRSAGALLLVVPHLIGAPEPQFHGGAAPASLADRFVVATTIANAVFWVSLGALTALIYRRFG